MKDSLDQIIVKLKPTLVLMRRYRGVIFLVILLAIYGILIIKVSVFNKQEPVDSDVNAKLQTVTRPHLDQDTIDKINDLQDNSVQVKSLFNSARKNPFKE